MADLIQLGFATSATAPRLCLTDCRQSSAPVSTSPAITIRTGPGTPAPQPPAAPPPATSTAPSARPFNLNDNLTAWEARVKAKNSAQTAKAKISRVRTFFEWAIAHGVEINDWRDVTPALVDRFIEYRLEAPHARTWNRLPSERAKPSSVRPATVSANIRALRTWLEFNEEQELCGPLRSQYLRGRIEGRSEPNYYSLPADKQEWVLERAWLAVRGQRDLKYTEPGSGKRKSAWCAHWPPRAFHAFVRIGLELGLRPRELFYLAWDDFADQGNGTAVLEIRDHYADVNGRRVLVNKVKTTNSRRKLVVNADLWTELQELRESLESSGDLRPFLFAVRDNRARCGWIKPEVHFVIKSLKEDLGEPRFRLNTLRKTCGKNLREQGHDFFVIAAVLGHQPETCMKSYVSDRRDHEALDPATCKPVPVAVQTGGPALVPGQISVAAPTPEAAGAK